MKVMKAEVLLLPRTPRTPPLCPGAPPLPLSPPLERLQRTDKRTPAELSVHLSGRDGSHAELCPRQPGLFKNILGLITPSRSSCGGVNGWMDGWRRGQTSEAVGDAPRFWKARLSRDADQSAAKQTEHTPGRWEQKHPDGRVRPYKAEPRPSVPGAQRQNLI